jgi:hypothetical protein
MAGHELWVLVCAGSIPALATMRHSVHTRRPCPRCSKPVTFCHTGLPRQSHWQSWDCRRLQPDAVLPAPIKVAKSVAPAKPHRKPKRRRPGAGVAAKLAATRARIAAMLSRA